MGWSSRKNGKATNIILVLICVVLIAILGVLLLTNHKEVKQESERLQKLSEKQETGIDDYDSVKEHASELKEEAAEEEDTAAEKKPTEADVTSTPDKVSPTDKPEESEQAGNSDKSKAESGDSEKK